MKTLLFTAGPGAVTPVVGTNTIQVTSWDTPIGIVIEPDRLDDKLLLVRQNGAGNAMNIPVTEDGKEIFLHSHNREVALAMPDIYGLRGYLKGTAKVYKVTE